MPLADARRWIMGALAALALALVWIPGRAAAASLLFTFQSCGFDDPCPANPTTIASFLFAGSALTGPALPSGTGPAEVGPAAVTGITPIAGSWSGLYLTSYRTGGIASSFFLFDRLVAANGRDYRAATVFDTFFGAPTRSPLSWTPGIYTDLNAYECVGGLGCPGINGPIDFVLLTVTEVVPVPAPGGALILLAGLAGLVAARRRG